MILHVFDLDKTILSVDSEQYFIKFLYKRSLISTDVYNKGLYFYNSYKLGKLDTDGYYAFYNDIVNIQCVSKVVDEFLSKIKRKFYSRVVNVFKGVDHKVISTASNFFLSKYICGDILKSDFISTNYSKGINNYHIYKVINIVDYIKNSGHLYKYVYFYTDSLNDIPMIDFSDKTYFINPSKEVLSYFSNRKNNVSFLFCKKLFKFD